MSNRPIISFCIPTYNRAGFVTRCVKNILQYPGDDIEVVVSNNGSVDETLAELQKIKDKRLKIFSNESNLGFTKNVLLVVERATGEFCFTMSDEDIVFVDKIPDLIKLCKSSDKGVIFTLPVAKLINKENNEAEDFCVRHYVKKDKYDFDKIGAIEMIFIESYLTGYILRRDIIPFDLINSEKCPNISLYPHNFMNLLAFDKMGASFVKDTFIQLNWEADNSFIFDEKVICGESYTHPLARIEFLNCHIEWIKLLNLTENERIEVLFLVYRMALNRFCWSYSDSMDTGYGVLKQVVNNKVSKEVCVNLSKEYILKAQELKKNFKVSIKYEEYLIKLINEFKEQVIE